MTAIPALMIFISGGLIVTRTSSETKLRGPDRDGRLSGSAQDSIPGVGRGRGRHGVAHAAKNCHEDKTEAPVAAPAPESLEALLKLELLAVEVGLGLVQLMEGGQNSQLLRRIASIRRQLATE